MSNKKVLEGISYVLSMIRQIKARSIIKNTLTYIFIRNLKAYVKLCSGGKLFRPSILLLLLGYGLINGILFDIGVDLNNKKADEYVNILEEKSARLKQLIEDLVEASKASSGNLTVNAEKIDLHELVMQACGEYEERIKKAELDIPPEQLTERFICGDVSRTAEGSGLGLSIAQSLANLQGGSFKIEIDGDLFKVNIEVPLWR